MLRLFLKPPPTLGYPRLLSAPLQPQQPVGNAQQRRGSAARLAFLPAVQPSGAALPSSPQPSGGSSASVTAGHGAQRGGA